MATIGKIAIGLTARTASFSKKMSRARRSVRKFGSSVGAVSRRIGVFAGAIAAVAAGGGLVLMTKRSFDAIDATAKLSDELGITTEALTGFQHAAALSGTQSEILNKGLQRMVRRLGEAKTGFGEGVRGLELMGLKAEELTSKSPAEALTTVAERIQAIADPTERAAAAYALFGRQGQELMNFLMMGREGLEAAAAEADALGLSFSRIDAAKVEAANDAITRVRATFSGLFNQIAINLAPMIEHLSTKFVEWATSGEGAASKVVKGFEWVVMAIAKVADGFQLLKAIFHGVAAGIQKLLQGLTLTILQMLKPLLTVAKLIPGISGTARTAQASLEGAAKGFGDEAADSWDKALDAADAFNSGKNSTAVEGFFKNLKSNAQAAGEEIAKRMEQRSGAAGAAAAGRGAARTGVARQVQLERIALQGTAGMQAANRPQEVRSKQLEIIHNDLSRMERNLTGYAVAG